MPKPPSPERPARPPLQRLATRIHAQILAAGREPSDGFAYALASLGGRATQLTSIQRRLELCRHHHLALAGLKVREELVDLLRYLPSEVDSLSRQIPSEVTVLSVGEIVQELQHLEDEFEDWRYEAADKTLAVVTDSIVLEEMNFGSFEIHLVLDNLGRSSRHGTYKVVALDPHRAASNEAVTHPHVSDQHLCEGEASTPIHAALAEGRIGDFFSLVRCVLTTYNPSSPYVAIENWDGTACHDCGYIAGEDDRHYCDSCNHDYCDECFSYCRSCDESYCRSCLEECPACEEPVCSHCLKRCNDCGKPCCESCLEEGVCPDCKETPEPQGVPDDHQPQPVAAASGEPAPVGAGVAVGGAEVSQSPAPVVRARRTPAAPRRRPTRRRTRSRTRTAA